MSSHGVTIRRGRFARLMGAVAQMEQARSRRGVNDMARGTCGTKKNGRGGKGNSKSAARERTAQSRTQLGRRGDGSKGSPARALSPSDERRPVAGRLIIIGGHEDREHDRLILRQVTDC